MGIRSGSRRRSWTPAAVD